MKVGRNQLCLCGSGLKYKRCCLTKQNVAAGPSLNVRSEFTVPAVVVEQVLNGIHSLPDGVLFQRIQALADSQPTLYAFITMLASSLPGSSAFPAALSAFAIIWMFSQHHQRPLPKIDITSIERCFSRNADSFLDFDSLANASMSGRHQPHIHSFVADAIFDFDENDFGGFDLFRLFMMLKTTVDILHETTSNFTVADSSFVLSAAAL